MMTQTLHPSESRKHIVTTEWPFRSVSATKPEVEARSASGSGPRSWREQLAWWLGLGFGPSAAQESALPEYAELARASRSPAEARRALVRLAQRMTGACRVELELEEPKGSIPRRAESWPDSRASISRGSVEALPVLGSTCTSGSRSPRLLPIRPNAPE